LYTDLFNNPPGQKVFYVPLGSTSIKDQIRKLASPDISTFDSSFTAVSPIAASADVDGRLVGYPIFDPRITQLSKDSDAWTDFCDTNFAVYFGDAQFVAVREGLVVFNIKSLDFDPTPAIGAGAASARLGLKVAGAAISGATGIPIGSVGGSGTASTENGKEQSQIVVNDAGIAADTDLLSSRKNAKMVLLGALADLDDKAALPGADLAEIKSTFRSYLNYYQGSVFAGKE